MNWSDLDLKSARRWYRKALYFRELFIFAILVNAMSNVNI
jgi:hypothetical protein